MNEIFITGTAYPLYPAYAFTLPLTVWQRVMYESSRQERYEELSLAVGAAYRLEGFADDEEEGVMAVRTPVSDQLSSMLDGRAYGPRGELVDQE